jgi:hypothetical protein
MDYNALISAGAGLAGVIVGGACTAYNQWRGRLNERYRDQLQNFYSIILGMRQEIKAKSELRMRLHEIARAQFPSIARTASQEEKATYDELINYSDKQLKEELVPTYLAMAKLFTERMYLAEPSTRKHFSKLIEFVEIWKRFLVKSVPYAVAEAVGHSEKDLVPFYEDVEENFRRLQGKLSSI